MKKRIIIIPALVLITGLFVFAYSYGRQSEKKEAVEEDKIQIGVSFDSFVIERWLRDRDVFVSAARDLGAEVTIPTRKACARE